MNKIRIRLKAYDHMLLDKSTAKIVKKAKDTGALAYIGRSQSWLTKWVNRDTNFKYACQNVRQKAVGVDELPNNELKRVAKWHLVQMLNDPELTVEKRLAVIKQIHSLPDEEGVTTGAGRGKIKPNGKSLKTTIGKLTTTKTGGY